MQGVMLHCGTTLDLVVEPTLGLKPIPLHHMHHIVAPLAIRIYLTQEEHSIAIMRLSTEEKNNATFMMTIDLV